jgi:hypothetical protein
MGACPPIREIFYRSAHCSGRMGNCAHSFDMYVKAILQPLAKDTAQLEFAAMLHVLADTWMCSFVANGKVNEDTQAALHEQGKTIRLAAATKAEPYIEKTRKLALNTHPAEGEDAGSAGVQGRSLEYLTIFRIGNSGMEPRHLRGKMPNLVRAPEVTEARLRGWRPLVGPCPVETLFSAELLEMGRFWGRMPGPHEDLSTFSIVDAT